MKKVAMFTMGTRGDVQPYIFLSKELIRNGYEVTLGSHPCWRKLIEDEGISFEPIGPDIDIEKEAAIIRGKVSNPVLSLLKTASFVFRIIQESTDEIYNVCKGKDLIIVSHSQMGAVEADVLGIPTVNVTLQKEMVGEKLKTKTFKDKLIGGMIARQVAKPYNKIRKVYGQKPLKDAGVLMSDKLNLIPISKYVVERNPYWEDINVMTGYWYDEEAEYFPDEKISRFLEAGEKPVILALGAMSFEDKAEKEKLEMFVHAFEKTGCRAIIQGFQKSIADYELPETMIACGSVPHSWLFKQGKFVIHHCGFGTTAATMIYGIPSIPVPHVLDQMGFAAQLCDAGVSTKPIKAKDLSEASIISAIEEMNRDYQDKKEKAEAISEKIKSEGGVAEAVRLINEVMESTNSTMQYSSAG
ncbi:glycosyltransferase [Butyrivibrio sp. VCD2006]|uniref:glycosyltransferase n=1 Tax=Butyrivibrio sp. VCD2006 TaxID=1280664 RepID=UPI00042895E9|nr:glycosyltransferase [Butyrivibrio sp. VCD2006]